MFEIEVTIGALAEEPLCQIFSELGIDSCAIYTHSEKLTEDELWENENILPPDGLCRVVGYTAQENAESLVAQIEEKIAAFADFGFDLGAYTVDVRQIMDIDWAEEHKKYYAIAEIDNMVICPVWDVDTLTEEQKKKLVILLEPGAAFGTGLHETTRMCMRLLHETVKPGIGVFDVGSGSGILSILASKLGAGLVYAGDIDSLAIAAGIKNSALNEVSNITFLEGDFFASFEGKVDLVVANIIVSILKELIPQAKQRLTPGGKMILSGILDTQLKEMDAVLSQNGFVLLKTLQEGQWVSLLAEKKE